MVPRSCLLSSQQVETIQMVTEHIGNRKDHREYRRMVGEQGKRVLGEGKL